MSRLIHRSKPSEPTFSRTSAKRAASWFLQCFSLSSVSSEDLRHSFASTAQSARGSWLQMAAEGYESGYESGMNQGYESGDRFFSTGKTPRVPQEHKDSLCFTATVAQDRQLPPRRTDCRKQAPSFKLSSGTPPPQRPASPSVLRQAAPPRHSHSAGHPQDCSITPSIGKNGPPRVTSECVSGHVNCTWPHDIRAQPCKHRRLEDRSRNHK